MGLDGETGRVRKAEGAVGATATEEGGLTGETGEVEEALEPAKETDEGGGGEKDGDEAASEISREMEARENL